MGLGSILGGVAKAAAPFASLVPGAGPFLAAGLGAAGSALSGGSTGKANKNAIAAQLAAINRARGDLNYGLNQGVDTYREGQRENYDLNLPYLQVGQQGLLGLSDMMKNGGQNPDFQFDPSQVKDSPFFAQAMQEGLKALNRSAAGKSRLLSGGTMKELLNYGESLKAKDYADEYSREFGLATQKYNAGRQNVQDLYGRYLGLSNIGNQAAARTQDSNDLAANSIAKMQFGTGQDMGNLNIQEGNTRASGYKNSAAINANLAENLGDSIGQFLSLRQSRGGSYGTPPFVDNGGWQSNTKFKDQFPDWSLMPEADNG
jgi:hypothetical protein